MESMQKINVSKCSNVAEAIQAAGLDWQSEQRDIFLDNGTKILGRKAIVRSDNGQPLGIVSDKYAPISNSDTFAFFDNLIATGVIELDSAGYVGSGRNVFLQGKVVNGTFETSSGDTTDLFIMAWNSHDGSSALKFFVSAMRFVCKNMFRLLQSDASTFIRATHTVNSVERWKVDINATLDILRTVQDDYVSSVRQLQKKTMGLFAFKDFAKVLVNNNEKKIAQLASNFYNGLGAEYTRFTAWGALNAVTEFTTHEQTVRAPEKDTARFFSSIAGAGNDLNTKAYNMLLSAG